MAETKNSGDAITRFADHVVITRPNPLKGAIRRVSDDAVDDSVARAENALNELATEFEDWMKAECDRLAVSHATIGRDGFSKTTIDEFFRASHDIKGSAATFGYPVAGTIADSLCRIIEHAPDLKTVPFALISHHVEAIQAIVREGRSGDKPGMADELSMELRRAGDAFLIAANQDRPEHLEALLASGVIND